MMQMQWIDKWGDRLNPVLVKEMRQSLHNMWIVAFSAIVLLGELLLLLLVQVDALSHSERGQVFFALLLSGLAIGGVIVGGVMPMRRFSEERRRPELDFSLMTNLGSFRMVAGRLASALLMIGLLFSMGLPFMVIAYFLGGVSLLSMLVLALGTAGILLVVALGGLLCGAAGSRWALAGFLAVLFGSGWAYLVMVIGWAAGSGSGVFSLTWQEILLAFCGLLLISGLLFVLTQAAVMPPAANRMLPVRLYTLLLWLLVPVLPMLLLSAGADKLENVMISWLVVGSLLLWLASAIAACERMDPSERVLRGGPRNRAGRFICFLFSSGAGGGLLFCWLLAASLAVVWVSFFDVLPWDWRGGDGIPAPLLSGMIGLLCAQLTLILRRWAARRMPGWGVYLIVLGGWLFINCVLQLTVGLNSGSRHMEQMLDWLTLTVSIVSGLICLPLVGQQAAVYVLARREPGREEAR